MHDKPVFIFDMDGTLLSINSFPYWVRYLLYGRFAGLNLFQRMLLSLRTLLVMIRRKLLKQDHARTKARLQILWSQALAKDASQLALAQFCAQLHAHVRPSLRGILPRCRDVVLATAATEGYALPFGRQLGFTHILCTLPGQCENSCEEKRDRVLALLLQLGWQDRPRVFLTDHREDLPLIKASQCVLWFGDAREMERIRQEAPQVHLADYHALTAAEIMALTA